MAVLDIRGVRVGEGRAKAIVSLMASDFKGLAREASQAVAAGADLVEWRADYLNEALGAEDVRFLAGDLRSVFPELPIIFTFRSAGQGGRRALSATEYHALNEAAIDSGGVDVVDLELGRGEELIRRLVARAHARGVRVIVSHHDFEGTPEVGELVETLHQLSDLGADIPKLATMARSYRDCLHMMEATAQSARILGKPLLTMAMGEEGRMTRICGEAFGSALTFCSVGKASAPGQVSLDRALPALEALHRALCEEV